MNPTVDSGRYPTGRVVTIVPVVSIPEIINPLNRTVPSGMIRAPGVDHGGPAATQESTRARAVHAVSATIKPPDKMAIDRLPSSSKFNSVESVLLLTEN